MSHHGLVDMLPFLTQWHERGGIRALDLAFARFIDRQVGGFQSPLQWLAVTLVSERTAHGHVCLDINAIGAICDELALTRITPDIAPIIASATTHDWLLALQQCAAVATNNVPEDEVSREEGRPLVLAGTPSTPLLYLRRFWQYEQRILEGIKQRLPADSVSQHAATLLKVLFAHQTAPTEVDWQQVACALALRQRFCIITGGPGTGKTTTVLRVLALLQGLGIVEQRKPYVIKLAAPTGKAAARLNESIMGDLQKLHLQSSLMTAEQQSLWQASIPTEVSTLHRLLGSQANTRHFSHQRANPLAADIVVVDEASMVDVEMMSHLLDALRPDARLILLGDKNQLASVEAGSVLGDLCQFAASGAYTKATCDYVKDVAQQTIPAALQTRGEGADIAQATCMLRHCYRAEGRGILALADWVNEQQVLRQGMAPFYGYFDTFDELHQVALERRNTTFDWQPFDDLVLKGYRHYLAHMPSITTCSADSINAWVEQLFQRYKSFQLLCAVRRGDFGVEALNQRIQSVLAKHGLLTATTSLWYPGRPVLVTQNDYALKLMNGDIGICLRLPWEDGEKVAFYLGRDAQGKARVRWVLPSRLQQAETVFAMTVHKSQGSEFAHTVLVLPDSISAVLTKELFYTAVTRSKTRFSLVVPNEDVLHHCLAHKVQRQSGLLG